MAKMILIAILTMSGLSFADANIPAMYRLVAEEHRVPAKLFYALILNESRSATRVGNGKSVLPWPWTINHRGTPNYFSSRQEAVKYAMNLVKRNDKQFDVGLGQLNWYWHGEKFTSLWDAFEPYLNLTEAAKFLREQYERPECSSWEIAIGCYHRPGQKPADKRVAQRYAERVIQLWVEI
jgi:hypothetical protein